MMILEFLYGLVFVAFTLISVGSLVMLRRFLHETPTIADHLCLERFKTVARAEMYAALLVIGILVPGVIISMLLTISRGLPALAVVIVTNFGLWVLSRYHKKVEVQTRSLRVTDALAQEYQRVSESWLKKALPDF